VRGGLAAGDRVVIEGVQMAIPGTKVTARRGRIDAPPPAPLPAPAVAARDGEREAKRPTG
jgi:membrane fusion protein, multidrug efflux system